MDFKTCTSIFCFDEFGRSLSSSESPTILRLSFIFCEKIVAIDALGKSSATLQKLEDLDLNVREIGITSIEESGSLSSLEAHTRLKLDCKSCTKLASIDFLGKTCIDEFGRNLSSLEALTHLKLSFTCCKNLASVDTLGKSVATLQKLEALQLDCLECDALASMDEFGKSMKSLHIIKDNGFSVHFPMHLCERGFDQGHTEEKWCLTKPEAGTPLNPSIVTLYDFIYYRILPFTPPDRLSIAPWLPIFPP